MHTASLARGVSSGRPQPPEEPSSQKGRPVAIVGGVIGAAVAVAAGAWFFLLNPSHDNIAGASPTPSAIVTPGPTATAEPTIEPTDEPTPAPTAFRAPRFTGRTVDEAEELAARGGLQLEFEFDETSSEADGTILEQDPAPGAAVRPGDTIVLTVAKSGPTVLVPDLRGQTEDDALNLLLDADLAPGERTQAFDDEIPVGAVVSTDPEADAEVDRQSEVDYVVSLGVEPSPSPTVEPTPTEEPTPAPVSVPELQGVPEEDAVNQLLDLGLEPGERTEAFDSEVVQGAVVSTEPAAGVQVAEGTTVDYVVSLGVEPTPTPEPTPSPVAVPDLRGVAESDAVNQLLDLGLEPGERAEAFDDQVANGSVISTDPEAGTELPPGTAVDYVVSLGGEPTPTPEPTPSPVAVPDLRGVAESDALNQLLDLGLQPGERTEAFDSEVAQGALMSTDPAAGEELPPGTTVDYVVSLGVEPTPTPEPTPSPVAVPDLRGVAEEDAVNQLLDLGLEPGERTERFHDTVSTGAVIRTDPPAGDEVPPGTVVDYVVSLGVEPTPTPEPTPAPVAVPDLRGVAESDAVNQLLDLGLQPGGRTEAFDGEVVQGAVVSTNPEAGAELPPGTTVDYVVSQGPEPTPTPEPTPAPVAVPDLRGVAESDAVNQLLDLGLQPGGRSEAFDQGVASGAVVSTDPVAGVELPPGTTVDYVVSLGVEPTPTPEPTPAPVAVPDLRGVAEADALNQLLDLGLQPGERSERFHDSVAAGAVIRTDPEAGTELPPGTTVDYVVSLGVEPTPTPEPTPAPVAVPDLRGVAESDAVSQLLDLGLQPGERSEAFDAEVAPGAVVGTDPSAGEELPPGTTVDYVVSLGIEPTPTPEPTAEPTRSPRPSRRSSPPPSRRPSPPPRPWPSPTSVAWRRPTHSTSCSTWASSPASGRSGSTRASRLAPSSAPTHLPARSCRPAPPSTTWSRWASSPRPHQSRRPSLPRSPRPSRRSSPPPSRRPSPPPRPWPSPTSVAWRRPTHSTSCSTWASSPASGRSGSTRASRLARSSAPTHLRAPRSRPAPWSPTSCPRARSRPRRPSRLRPPWRSRGCGASARTTPSTRYSMPT
ncbi:MAG: PASTA domain-containing protein [Chloroflexota bacterium]